VSCTCASSPPSTTVRSGSGWSVSSTGRRHARSCSNSWRRWPRPAWVDWPAHPGYRPAHEEGHGRQALVAIFTDGEGLAQRLDNPRSRLVTERLLRSLRRWPRLCFVDCAATGARLGPLLEPYGLETIALAELPYWLGGVALPAQTPATRGTDVYGDARA